MDIIEGIQLKMHLFICRYCSNYAKQTRLIDKLLKRLFSAQTPSTDTTYLEEKIFKELQK